MNKTNAEDDRIQAVSPEFVSALALPETRITKPKKMFLTS